MHSIIYVRKSTGENSPEYKSGTIRSYDGGFRLEDDSIPAMHQEYAEITTNHIQPIFPQLVIQQIRNTLVARQLLPKGPDHFELVFHFFGYTDDTPELRRLRIKQADPVGPAGYISMERYGSDGAGATRNRARSGRHLGDRDVTRRAG